MPDQNFQATLYQCFGLVGQPPTATNSLQGRSAASVAIGVAAALPLLVVFWSFQATAQDNDPGRQLFAKCRACHSLEAGKNGVGPSLHGVVGRKSGSLPGFKFSQPMASKNVVWNEDNLVQYLRDPKGFVPGNKMVFPGLRKEGEAESLVAFLKKAGN